MMRFSVRATASRIFAMASMFAEMLVMPCSTSQTAIFGSEPAWPQIEHSTSYARQVWIALWIK